MCGILYYYFANQKQGKKEQTTIEFTNEEEISNLINLDLFSDISQNNDKYKQFVNEIQEANNGSYSKMIKLQYADKNSTENSDHAWSVMYSQLLLKILSRGPNYANFTISENANSSIWSFSSILSLRQPFTKQPISSSKNRNNRYKLQFNGELYNPEIQEKFGNDTRYLMNKIESIDENFTAINDDNFEMFVKEVFSDLEGEFAFVLHDILLNKVYFGKDFLGRRALLYKIDTETKQFMVGSIPDNDNYNDYENNKWIDCEGNTIYCLDLQNFTLLQTSTVSEQDSLIFNINDTIVTKYNTVCAKDLGRYTEQLGLRLQQAVDNRIYQIHPLHDNDNINSYIPPRNLNDFEQEFSKDIYQINPKSIKKTGSKIAILFSGGIDCTILTYLAAKSLSKNNNMNPIIDLINVSFENRRTKNKFADTPDRKLGISSWMQLCKIYEGNLKLNFIEVDVSYSEYLKGKQRVRRLMWPHNTEMDLSIGIAFFFASRGWGTKLNFNSETGKLWREPNVLSDSKVLFSGLGADELFGGYSRHDRVFNPFINRFNEIGLQKKTFDINELEILRRRYGIETLTSDDDSGHDLYCLLKGYDDLAKELSHDISVIWQRNLSRDDKVVSSWGKELRYPFLSTEVVKYACHDIPLNFKVWVDFHASKPEGKEEAQRKDKEEDIKPKKKNMQKKYVIDVTKKYILRNLASDMGLHFISKEPKRAIQFGTKSAKMEPGQGRVKGTDVF